jgi:hypothetical protein
MNVTNMVVVGLFVKLQIMSRGGAKEKENGNIEGVRRMGGLPFQGPGGGLLLPDHSRKVLLVEMLTVDKQSKQNHEPITIIKIVSRWTTAVDHGDYSTP